MKKKSSIFLIVLCLALVLSISLCACGEKKEEGKETTSQAETIKPQETTKAHETTAPAETTKPQETTKENSKEPTEPAALEEETLYYATSMLLEQLNTLNRLYACAIDQDTNSVYVNPDNGLSYFYVTEPEFQSWGDIVSFMEDSFTWDFCYKYVPELADTSAIGDFPMYLYVQEEDLPVGLYALNGGKGVTFYNPYVDFTYSDIEENSFTAYVPYDFFGEEKTLTLNIVWEDSAWNIDDMDKGL